MKNQIIIKAVLINLIFWSVSSLTFGQSEIQGYVTSSLTDLRPISDIYIEIVNIDKPVLARSTMVDSSGFYRLTNLEKEKTYKLKVLAFGYANQIFEIVTETEITEADLILTASCAYSKQQAETDWKKNKAKLLLVGSIAPTANSPADTRFEKKYNVKYYDFGCSPPIDECIQMYNERIFKLMDEKYGLKWRDKVRQDVEYFQ